MNKRYPDTTEVPVTIPTLDGKAIAETIKIEVPCRIENDSGEVILGGEAMRLIDKARARHMGLLLPDQIKLLRKRLCLTQNEISELLQIGAKSYTRWESGRERPSRSMNILLRSLYDAKIDINYLKSVKNTNFNWSNIIPFPTPGNPSRPYTTVVNPKEVKCDEAKQSAA